MSRSEKTRREKNALSVDVVIQQSQHRVGRRREAFGDRASFDLWWSAHQISASTMFGIKLTLTTHRIFRAILGMGSVVVVAAGLVLRSSLAGGGGGGG